MLCDLSHLISSPLSFVLSALATLASSPLFKNEILLHQGLSTGCCLAVLALSTNGCENNFLSSFTSLFKCHLSEATLSTIFKLQHLPLCSSIPNPPYQALFFSPIYSNHLLTYHVIHYLLFIVHLPY